MLTQANSKEFNANEGKDIRKKNTRKTFATLNVLCEQMNLNYYYHRSKMNYTDRPLVESLTKVMHKCIKLYMLIDTFMKIFTMIGKKEELEKIGRMKHGDK